MKFTVRDGFVVRFVRFVDTGNDTRAPQEVAAYAGQTIDLTETEAENHTHQLEPADKAAAAFLAGKVAPVTDSQALGISDQQQGIIQAMAAAVAAETVKSVLTALGHKPAADTPAA